MSLPERSSRLWLLSVLPLAWATSALLVLEEGGLLHALLGLAWLGVGWQCLAGRRTVVARRALALLVAAALPAQGFAAIAAEVSGPAHFHAAPAAGERHWHAGVMHHHHAPGTAVIVDDGKRSPAALASEETKRVAFGAVDAMAAAEPVIPSPAPAIAASPARSADCAAHFARPPERPPRLLRSSLPI
jgi:hypothetical protein